MKCIINLQGPDYDESADAQLRGEHVTGLLRRWELASVTWSSVDHIQSNNTRQQSSPSQSRRLQSQQQSQLQRGGSLNSPYTPTNQLVSVHQKSASHIMRPESSAPVYVQRTNAVNRIDGIQDVVHCPSPNMPRHVLESISQSPTQSLKNPPGMFVNSPPSRINYSHPEAKLTKASTFNNGDYGQREFDGQQETTSVLFSRNLSSSNKPYNVQQLQMNLSSSNVQNQQQQQQQQRKCSSGASYNSAQTT